jgi:hypothetical protein
MKTDNLLNSFVKVNKIFLHYHFYSEEKRKDWLNPSLSQRLYGYEHNLWKSTAICVNDQLVHIISAYKQDRYWEEVALEWLISNGFDIPVEVLKDSPATKFITDHIFEKHNIEYSYLIKQVESKEYLL